MIRITFFIVGFLVSFSVYSVEVQAGEVQAGDEKSGATNKIEEIFVTAQRRRESAQDVPISLTALEWSEVDNYLDNAFDLGKMLPNVQTDNYIGMSIPFFSIRGISNANFHGQANAPIMVYHDGLVLNSLILQGLPLYDQERIEVLRGPQGTLFGRNATGGAMQFISAKPEKEFGGNFNLTLGNYDRIAYTGAITGPISETLTGRFAFLSDENKGDLKNVTTGRKDGEDDYWSVRGIMDWEPTDKLSVRFKTQVWEGTASPVLHSSFEKPTDPFFGAIADSIGFTSNPGGKDDDFKHISAQFDQREKIDYDLYSIEINYDLSDYTLTAIGGFVDTTYEYFLSNSQMPIPIYDERALYDIEQSSVELRLASETSSQFQWMLGGFYLEEDSKARTNLLETGIFAADINNVSPSGGVFLPGVGVVTPAVPVVKERHANQLMKSYAFFVHTTFDWTEKLKTTHAIRWNVEDKDFTNVLGRFGTFASDLALLPGESEAFYTALIQNKIQYTQPRQEVDGDDSWNELTWRLSADYKLEDKKLLYASISKGFRGGAFNPAADTPSEVVTVNPETVISYEIGLKSDWYDGRLRINTAMFYSDYQDYQTIQTENIDSDFVQVLSNLDKASIYGAELELWALPTTNVSLMLGFGVVESEIKKANDPGIEGNVLPYAEDFNFNGMLRYEIPTEIGTFAPELRWNYRGNFYTTKENDFEELGDYWISDFLINYQHPNESFHLSFFVNNITDNVQVITTFCPSSPSVTCLGSDDAAINARRTYGIKIGVDF